MPRLNRMSNGFPQITEHNGVPILFTILLRGGKQSILAMIDLTDPQNPKWVRPPVNAGEQPEVIQTDEVLWWNMPPWI